MPINQAKHLFRQPTTLLYICKYELPPSLQTKALLTQKHAHDKYKKICIKKNILKKHFMNVGTGDAQPDWEQTEDV